MPKRLLFAALAISSCIITSSCETVKALAQDSAGT